MTRLQHSIQSFKKWLLFMLGSSICFLYYLMNYTGESLLVYESMRFTVDSKSKTDYERYLSQHPEIHQRFKTLGGDHILYSNPLLDAQCRNAIVYKENIDIQSLLAQNMKRCPQCFANNHSANDIVWSRELIDFMQKRNGTSYHAIARLRVPSKSNYSSKARVLVPQLATMNISVPTYYHLEKCASSSVYYNLVHSFGNQWDAVEEKGFTLTHIGQTYQMRTGCGYTFVRNPITRFIAGYYMINIHIYLQDQKMKNVSRFIEAIKKHSGSNKTWSFLGKYTEPDRFLTFVDEMISNPYMFSWGGGSMAHISTMTAKAFTVFHNSDLQFIGKVEFMDEHWDILLDRCSWFRKHLVNRTHRHANANKGQNMRRNAFRDMLGFTEYAMKNKTGLYPAYYMVASNKTLYDLLVHYYWQDFVCFGYEPDFVEFKRFVLHPPSGSPKKFNLF
eukprot:312524_1